MVAVDQDPRPDAWGPFIITRPLVGGHRNRAFEVSGPTGRFVLKSTRRSEEAITWLDQVQTYAERSDIRVPRYVRSLNGKFVEYQWTLEEYIDGAPLEKEQQTRLRAALTTFHGLTRSMPQRPGFASASQLIGVDRGGDVDLTRMPDLLVHACRRAWQVLKTEPCAVVHGDLNPGNILVDDHSRLTLIDWDEARVDATVFDDLAIAPRTADDHATRLALLAWEIACSWQLEPDYAARLADTLFDGVRGTHPS